MTGTDEQTVTCTDCGDALPLADRQQHMKHEHGVNYTIPEPAGCCCGKTPCERAVRVLSGGGK